MATFAQWLAVQDSRQDEVGELARTWKADTGHGNLSSPAGIGRFIAANWDDAETWAERLKLAADEHHAAKMQADPTLSSLGHLQELRNEIIEASRDYGDRTQPMLDVLLKRAREQSAQLAWLQAAVSFLLPDDVLKKLNDQEADSGLAWDGEAVPVDFGALLALADFTAAEGAGDA